ncbi:MAG: membrane or secreted protein [Rubripirellula sp.]
MRRPRTLQQCGLLCTLIMPCLLILAGCSSRPLCAPKGTMNQQQASAIVHDPFPQSDIGPSDASARPPSYQQPLPEAERNRIVADAMPWLGR